MSQGISVVVPVRGRVVHVGKLLESLERARAFTRLPTEVIIVDNSPDEETQGAILRLCQQHQASYHYVCTGASGARNKGTELARFGIVLFVDSDCEVAEDVLEQHALSYQDGEVAGCVGVTEFFGAETRLWRVIERMSFVLPFGWVKWKQHPSWGPCSNISLRKCILTAVGGFSSILPPRECSEDVDLGLKVWAQGYRLRGNAAARVYHACETWQSLSQLLERCFRFGRGEWHLLSRHPLNRYPDVPRVSFLWVLLSAFCLALVVGGGSWSLLAVPLTWLTAVVLVQTACVIGGRLTESTWRDYPCMALVTMCELIFELGTLFESVRQGAVSPVLFKFIYTEEQLLSRWRWGVVRTWSVLLPLICLFALLYGVR